MPLEPRRDLSQLSVGARHDLLERHDRLRGTNARHHVLTLRVHEELAVELPGPGCGVAGEPDARRRPVTGVPEDHHLDVHRGADVVRDVVDAPVFLRARVVPRPEHGVAGHAQLREGVLGKGLPRPTLHDGLVTPDDLAERLLVEVGIEAGAPALLDRVELLFERVLGNFEHDVAEHLDEAAVAVVGEPAVRRPCLQPLDGFVGQAEVQDRVHHPRHRELRAGPHADEQGVLAGTERRAGNLLERAQVGDHLQVHRLGEMSMPGVVERAGFRGNREPWRHRQAGVGHLRQSRALAAQQVLHRAIAVGLALPEEVDVLALCFSRCLVLRLAGL